MFARKIDHPTQSRPTPAEIAASVRKPAALQAALLRWQGLRKRNEEIASAIRLMIAEKRTVPNTEISGHDNRISTLSRKRESLVGQVADALAAVHAARGPYLDNVTAALRPLRQSAAADAIAAIAFVNRHA